MNIEIFHFFRHSKTRFAIMVEMESPNCVNMADKRAASSFVNDLQIAQARLETSKEISHEFKLITSIHCMNFPLKR